MTDTSRWPKRWAVYDVRRREERKATVMTKEESAFTTAAEMRALSNEACGAVQALRSQSAVTRALEIIKRYAMAGKFSAAITEWWYPNDSEIEVRDKVKHRLEQLGFRVEVGTNGELFVDW